MKIVIGIIGEKGSGKGTFSEILEKISRETVACVKSSDVLRDTLTMWDLPITRSNLQQLAIIMNAKYGDSTLSHAVEQRILKEKADFIIYDGIRWPSDVSAVRDFPKNILVYVTAPAGIRYNRTKNRNEKAGEGSATFEQFMAEEQVETETKIIELAKQAEVVIENSGTKEQFEEEIRKFYSSIL